jgi:polysaccharide biosynthesis protein VpsQ
MLIKRWLPFLLFAIFVAGTIFGSNLGRLGTITHWVNTQPFGDKCGHLILIGFLTYLLNHALDGREINIGRLKLLLGCTIVAVVMTIEEISQIWIPSRSFDFVDLSANYLGIAIAGFVWLRQNPV